MPSASNTPDTSATGRPAATPSKLGYKICSAISVALYGPFGNTSVGAAPTDWVEMRVVKRNEIAIKVDVSLRIVHYISRALGRFASTPSFVLADPLVGIEVARTRRIAPGSVHSGKQPNESLLLLGC